SAGADDGFLDFGWREFIYENALLFGGKQNHAARLPEHNSCSHVARIEDVLHRERIGFVSRDQLADTFMYLSQSSGQWVSRSRANDAALDERGRPAAAGPSDDAVPRTGRARIDAEDEHVSRRCLEVFQIG